MNDIVSNNGLRYFSVRKSESVVINFCQCQYARIECAVGISIKEYGRDLEQLKNIQALVSP